MKKEFDWDKFKNEKIAVHCKTEEEAKDFCRKMHEQGMRWGDGDSYFNEFYWNSYRGEICYTGHGSYSFYSFYKKNNYTILEWSDYMQKDFTKTELKDWMVIEQRNKERYVILGEKLLNDIGFNYMDGIEDDLTDRKFKTKDFDIIKVYKINTKKIYKLGDIFKDENLELIWERTEPKRMTAEEMRVKLEEMTGDKIEIEGNRRVGRWFLLDECLNSGVYCSICGKKVYKEEYANQKIKSKYCPNCGSIMEY